MSFGGLFVGCLGGSDGGASKVSLIGIRPPKENTITLVGKHQPTFKQVESAGLRT